MPTDTTKEDDGVDLSRTRTRKEKDQPRRVQADTWGLAPGIIVDLEPEPHQRGVARVESFLEREGSSSSG